MSDRRFQMSWDEVRFNTLKVIVAISEHLKGLTDMTY